MFCLDSSGLHVLSVAWTTTACHPTIMHQTGLSSGLKATASLSYQYGGLHRKGSWVDLLPTSWIPYIQLCRLSPPAGLFLIYFAPVFGVFHAAATHHRPAHEVVHACTVLLVASFFGNNASHAWNDLVDADIDARIERTKTRPIPRGAIAPGAAFVFAVTQLLGLGCSLLLFLPPTAALAAVPEILATIYYPWAKRHTHLPQLVLGFCLTWSIMVGSCAMGVGVPWGDRSTILLLLAAVLWVVIFDTVYAHQDLVDDVKIGVKSTAVLLKRHRRTTARAVLSVLVLAMASALFGCGYYGGFGIAYHILSVGGCLASVGSMVTLVDLDDPASCWTWFSQGFWLTGLVICGGLLVEYALQTV
ncbi:4-hydroxybenzoate polyprenyltransferase [Podospora australis]|uniref:Diterpenoid pyrone biosynthesis cluster protein C n=1 Tax=Podospora australis TaxID=1536484 RepID=A0AAN6WN07_9PEZI|nr:4-hydroxybenzoate polyprenyltransferase [Podospora australis]